jgi:hypothetical protein
VVIDEAALHRAVGGPAVMSAPLEHVVKASKLPDVTVQILPITTGAHPVLDSTFILLKFDIIRSMVVYVDALAGRLYLEQPRHMERRQQILAPPSNLALSGINRDCQD